MIGEDDYILLRKRVEGRHWEQCDLETYRKIPASLLDMQPEKEEEDENNKRKQEEQSGENTVAEERRQSKPLKNRNL